MAVPSDLLVIGPSAMAVAMALCGLTLVLAVVLVARRLVADVSKPLANLERAAKQAVAAGGAFEPGEDSGTFELASISSSFAALNARVEEGRARAAQSEKMAAIGTLAGGIAHEINNPLGVILGFAQGLERRVPEGDALRMPVMSIVREAMRCKQLVQELLTFARVSKKTEEDIDLVATVNASLLFLQPRAKTQGVEIVSQVTTPLPLLRGSKTQLQQVLLNLGTNALDAMKHGGTLTLSVQPRLGGVVLEVTDTGSGISEAIRGRVFEPFFTTKGVGEGTGLGLSLVYQIVQQHRGHIDLVTKEGQGTTMRVTLPSAATRLDVARTSQPGATA
ncbi:MAG: HAMP domain-containing histidine kinase [Archangiaceae bacterium]|nr:HAMP domain-containing histidine kinase [Archangiaceae bacterium]